ncbi:MAG: TIGR01777 family oxidoreductase [Gemmatimonadota bacterium]|nr:TIGR01777 family oxidoreductase [Gemmatimonadota bacterium]
MTTPHAEAPSRIIIAGGSGFIGSALAAHFAEQGHDVVVLTRTARARKDGVREVAWNGRSFGPWAKELDGAAAVVNLTGKNINCRHTNANRREIIASRVVSVRAVADAIGASATPVPVWVQASAVGIYGNAGDALCDESAPHGNDFMADVCEQWEAAFRAALTPDTRRAVLRFGVVLGRDGGALPTLATLARWGLGGTVGSGRQYISWIHRDDLVSVVDRAITTEMSGPYNAANHVPETNAAFMKRLRSAVHRPWSPPAPAFAVKIGAYVIGTEPSIALHGQRCVPKRLDEEGFAFAHEDLGQALGSLLRAQSA